MPRARAKGSLKEEADVPTRAVKGSLKEGD